LCYEYFIRHNLGLGKGARDGDTASGAVFQVTRGYTWLYLVVGGYGLWTAHDEIWSKHCVGVASQMLRATFMLH